MNALVRIALSRPYTFVVLAVLLLIVGPLAALRTPTDIFPEIRIPVIGVVWQYTGLPPDQMSGRIVTPFQRALTTTVNDIEHITANSYNTYGVIKIFFQPNVDIRTANAQVTAIAQTMLRQLPAGSTPPLILNYSASTVPIIQLALGGEGLTEQNMFDIATNQLRTPLVTVPGAAIPWPFGGKQRQIQLDINPTAMQALGLSGQDVANALAAQNLITPVGTQKIGNFEYNIQLNNAPRKIEELGNLPIKVVNGATVYIRDVAQVRDGNPPQTNIVHVDGTRSVLMMVLKAGATSTLDIISGIKQKIINTKDQLPEQLRVNLLGDQSIFVRGAIAGVAFEGVLAAALTSIMILLFLGSWRSTLIIAISIPLSVFGAIICLSAVGETLNIMTLGGLALAVGILVDDATVTIENINYHLEHGMEVEPAILEGARQIATPAFVTLLCICIVFVPMFFLTGVSRFLFVPMALSVMFAMTWSFILSRTLVPTMAKYLLHPHPHDENGNPLPPPESRNPLVLFQRAFEKRFERVRDVYHGLLQMALGHRKVFVIGFLGFVGVSFLLVPFLGRNFFPSVDTGQILIHVRTQIGTRVEETANKLADIQKVIRQVIPSDKIETMADNIGMPISGINLTYNNTGVIGPQDGDIQIKLKEDHKPTEEYVRELREKLPREFPGVSFAFLPADIVSQILNFGSPAPIDIQVRGANTVENFRYANDLLRRIKLIPGVADARIQQSPNNPSFDVNVDRTRAQYVGLTARDVTNSMVVNLAGSSQVAPTFFLDPNNGVSYSIVMQTPQYQIDSLNKLEALPISSAGIATAPMLGGIADIKRSSSSAVVSQYDIQTMVQIFATPQGRDLGAVAADINKVIAETAKDLPRGSRVVLLGQVETMNSAFAGLLFGLLGAIVLIYLLIVVNFQSWSDPFVIVSALPAALAGIVWMLFATHTTLSVPALTGAIMCMGVATANSVLVIAFARERFDQLGDPVAAALDAGFVRFRPVLMTALAMIIGMTPMALGMGEGGEQNAPLGRAVIGGLIFATTATLLFVPVVFSMVHKKKQQPATSATAPEMVHAT
ncbi:MULTISPECIES: efflux RND transporter permease subunit [unclassified Afipia]|uniref:efflux RND transporter permease subunit n=1 Tax=unclassified Afipia TaxID=2642050 RepID=UPI000467B892|nr:MULTISPECIES: efflux RND transporter permease subunit [unclassified Afipia]MAH71438.1 AcrB/AcrD/AcrF family protein [Afipia sp.]OUX59288.1 MAG: AcrB/AcrD/AcrF family protein [Afipia sp. TMED4]HAO41804.1 AcrB/AcrD/AcrF family protein [Afipia sp.]HAP10641.1 AcrB/AcrD/AcrF family protein [Afipia sp.]HAQ94520.1 AcrB/AcrD/AcrF family protein [Afipia sp.]